MTDATRIVYVGVESAGKVPVPALEEVGFQVRPATDRLDALRRLDADPADCVVCPCVASDPSIESFVQRVRDRDTPVVLFGGDSPERAIRGLRAGAADYVEGGLDAERVLVDRVREVVADERIETALERGRRSRSLAGEAIRRAWAAEPLDAAEAAVRETLLERYRLVWFGEYDADSGHLVVRTPAVGTIEPGELVDSDSIERAVSTGDVVVSRSDDSGEVAVVPFEDGGTDLLVVAGEGSRVFDNAERSVLKDVAEGVADAIGSKNRTGSRLIEEVAHELRGSLGVVATELERAREGETALDDVERALDRVDRTLENVLAVAGPDPLENRTDGDLAATAEVAEELLADADVDLVVEDSITVRADHDALSRLLANLFRNAAEHGSADDHSDAVTDRDGETVTVRVGSLDDGFYVADDGPGIPEAERDRVFEWGYSTAEGGTGIGLGVVREIARAHGWAVSVTESREGGARFEITGVDAAAS